VIRSVSTIGPRAPLGYALLVFGVPTMAGVLKIGAISLLIPVLVVVIFVIILLLLVVLVVLLLLGSVMNIWFGSWLLFMLLGIPFSLFLVHRNIEPMNVSSTAIVAVADVTILVVRMRPIGR
jgi:hypothetical protein